MSFFALVVRNILRRPGRSLLTALGVAVGIAAVVTLVSLARGFERSWAAAYAATGADLLAGRSASKRPLPAPFPDAMTGDFRSLPHVAAAAGVLTDLLSIEDAPAILVFGWEPGSFLWEHLTLLEGRWPRDGGDRAIALGALATETLGKKVGDTVDIEGYAFRVSGRYTSASFAENGSAVMALPQLQAVPTAPIRSTSWHCGWPRRPGPGARTRCESCCGRASRASAPRRREKPSGGTSRSRRPRR